jgi:hypothetical protein
MANPTSIGTTDYLPAIVEATTTAGTSSISVYGNKEYLLQHNGVGEDGAEHTGYVMVGLNETAPAATSGSGKMILISGEPLQIGPGVTSINFKASADDPTISVIPLRDDQGRH